eukprot:TRINITY_DN40608_c0_g1_i2.p1 TRINITY_DN40608_c0_g1~~TRINITY_DN40608_c0_g1_i2.p1  ORF type:complete len:689 (-),score=77.86 TRINITY_DN40608_c0_g1_i2:37-2103(-)
MPRPVVLSSAPETPTKWPELSGRTWQRGLSCEEDASHFQALMNELYTEYQQVLRAAADFRQENSLLRNHMVSHFGHTQDTVGVRSPPVGSPSCLRTDNKLENNVGVDSEITTPNGRCLDISDSKESATVSTRNDKTGAQTYALRHEWKLTENLENIVSQLVKRHGSFDTRNSTIDVGEEECSVKSIQARAPLQRFIMLPGTKPRIAWDFLGAFFILYDLTTIPLKVFDPPNTLLFSVFELVVLLYWSLNMLASPFMGYFSVDMLVLIPDWISRLTRSDNGAMASVLSFLLDLSILRVVRLLRILRVLRLKRLLVSVNDLFDSEYVSILAHIVKMVCLLLAINHCIACVWYAIATSRSDNWISAFGFEDADWWYLYLTSFHWSITQFTPSSMHVQPVNDTERLFTIMVVVSALIVFSYLVGSITSSLGQLRGMKESGDKQFWHLRCYLRQNKVPIALSLRIQKFLEHKWKSQQSHMPTQSVTILRLLSDHLASELGRATSVETLRVHPLLNQLDRISRVTVQRLSCNAISRKFLAAQDSLFYSGEVASHAYFVVAGRFQYLRRDRNGKKHQEWVDGQEDWIAEPVLWSPTWLHLGFLVAIEECEVLLINPAQFIDVASKNPEVLQIVSKYGQMFIDWMSTVPFEDLSDISQGEKVTPMIEGFLHDILAGCQIPAKLADDSVNDVPSAHH